MQQKKTSYTIKRNQTHKRQHKSSNDLTSYGPPPLPKPFIESSIGYIHKKQPLGLRKVRRNQNYTITMRGETITELAVRVGQTNLLRRYKNLNYLSSCNSKKTMFNLCEENLISKLQQSIQNIKKERLSLNHPKFS